MRRPAAAAARVASVALSLVLVVAGAVASRAGLRQEGPSLGRPRPSQVNGPSAGEAHNSPSVAVDGAHGATIVVANRLDAPAFGCALSASDDGGRGWRPVELTPALAATDCFWPRVAFDGRGRLLVLYTPLGGPNLLPVGLFLQAYEGLRPSGPPLAIAGDLAFHARLATSGLSVWVSWVQAGPATADNQLGLAPGDNPVVVARSDDGGGTFGPPVRVSGHGQRIIQPSVVVGDNGLVVVGALDLVDDRLNYEATHDGQTPPDPSLRWRVVCWTSTDGGRTFGTTTVVGDDLAVPQLIIADLGPTPGLARDPSSGLLYATWDAGRGNERDVFLAFSTDDGRSWSEPRPVGPRGGSQHLPAVGVSPGGRVDVVFYDRGRDPDDVFAEAALATSFDQGRTFTLTSLSERLFDTRVGLGMQQGVPLLGDQLAVASLPDRALALWADTSRGVALVENVQDLAAAVVEARPGQDRRPGLAAAGGAALAAGLALAVVVTRGQRRPRAAHPAPG